MAGTKQISDHCSSNSSSSSNNECSSDTSAECAGAGAAAAVAVAAEKQKVLVVDCSSLQSSPIVSEESSIGSNGSNDDSAATATLCDNDDGNDGGEADVGGDGDGSKPAATAVGDCVTRLSPQNSTATAVDIPAPAGTRCAGQNSERRTLPTGKAVAANAVGQQISPASATLAAAAAVSETATASAAAPMNRLRSVSFSPVTRTRTVTHYSGLSRDELSKLWTSQDEIYRTRQAIDYTVFLVKTGVGEMLTEDDDFCSRGLENIIYNRQHKTRVRKSQAVALAMQKYLRKSGVKSPDIIAKAYRAYTVLSRRLARQQALEDEKSLRKPEQR